MNEVKTLINNALAFLGGKIDELIAAQKEPRNMNVSLSDMPSPVVDNTEVIEAIDNLRSALVEINKQVPFGA